MGDSSSSAASVPISQQVIRLTWGQESEHIWGFGQVSFVFLCLENQRIFPLSEFHEFAQCDSLATSVLDFSSVFSNTLESLQIPGGFWFSKAFEGSRVWEGAGEQLPNRVAGVIHWALLPVFQTAGTP